MTAALAARDAYRLWADTYDAENPLTALDSVAVRLLSHDTRGLAGLDLLDAACGTGRRLVFDAEADAPRAAVGVDLVFEMLARGRRDAARSAATAEADVRALPFPAERFDVAWCRLAAGHLPELQDLYGELARVLRPGGRAIVTDFHPEAARRGHVRTFHGADGVTHVVAHVVHEAGAHEAAAAAAGLSFEARASFALGSESRIYYERAGRLDRLEKDAGTPLLLALKFRR